MEKNIALSSANSTNATMTNVVPTSKSIGTSNSIGPVVDVNHMPSDNNQAHQFYKEMQFLGKCITEVLEEKHDKDKFLCVIDLAATCIGNSGRKFFPHEIIEIPAVLINVFTRRIVSSFHAYCKPRLNPILSDFCKELTGISQEIVDGAESFNSEFDRFDAWLYSQTSGRVKIVTDGPNDVSKFLYLQCHIEQIRFPKWAERFVDVKVTYKMEHKKRRVKLFDMLENYGLKFEGRLHSGKDDAQNIARLVVTMLKHKEYFGCNTQVLDENKKYLERQMAIYYRKRQSVEDRKRRRSNKRRKSCKTFEEFFSEDFFDGSMDIDPDLIGSESILLKHKTKK